MFLLDDGNDDVTDTNFCGKTWTSTSDIEKFFYWNNAKDLTNTADVFEQFFDGDIVLEILNETNHYAQYFKYSMGYVVYMCSRVNELRCDSRSSMYFTGIF